MAILFPAGSTCETYEYGWQSTGCTGEDGATRGFTQEWYFDGDLAAWVAVSQDISVTGPVGPTGAINFGEPSLGPSFGHTANVGPTDTNDSGTLRKFVVLQDDGSLTFDYIKTPDLLRPSDVGAAFTSFSWQNRTADDLDNSNEEFGRNGFTLCAPAGHVYTWNTGASDEIFRAVFADGVFNDAPSGITIQLQAGYDTKLVQGLPKTQISVGKGTNSIDRADLTGSVFGISAGFGGPTYDWVKFEGRALLGGTHETLTDSNTLKTENFYYVFATASDFIAAPGSVTGSGQFNIPDAAQGYANAAGTYRLLPQGSQAPAFADHNLDITVTKNELGNAGSGQYVYVAFPIRVGLNPETDIFYSTAVNSPNGFRLLESITMDIPNELNYIEPYLVCRSQNAQGVPASTGIKISK